MKHLISWDDADDTVRISDRGWREPEPGELTRLAQIIDIKPKAVTRIEVLAVIGVIAAIGVLGMGGVW